PNTVLKAPWSGSGKGIAWGRGVYDTTLSRWSNGILQRQGSVIGEPFYEKAADLAMEFFSDGTGNVSFAGYSWFSTDNKGVYKSNWLASDEAIFSEIVKNGIAGPQLQQLQQAYLRLLSELVGPVYRGYFGIDMMIYRSGGTLRLHPCIEMNLRMNMGMVARMVYDRYVDRRVTGRYYVDYFPDSRQLNDDHRQRTLAYPVKMSSGRICSGYFSLTPVTATTHYRARMEIAIPE
ncbi:MAG: hypothetical protein J1E02_08665, partial [Coprobacter sp.]|nr:hypothetical protein [Coprobacter sp.]